VEVTVTVNKDPHAAAPARSLPRRADRLVLAAGLAVVVAVTLYAIGRVHTPDYMMGLFGRHGVAAIRLKALIATVILVLALAQLSSALWLYRRLPGIVAPPPAPVAGIHRVGGATLFLLSLPVAVHCILAYGVQLNNLRVAVHSVAGCFFYGAFAAKVLIVRSHRLPGWALPVAGGLLVTLVVVMWYSAALWYFAAFRLPSP
jgi:Family of unknown function (DUF6529)